MHRAGHSVLLNAMWLAKTSKTQRMLLGCGCVALQGTQICSLAMSLKRCYPPKSLGRMDIRYIYIWIHGWHGIIWPELSTFKWNMHRGIDLE
jgi:hypothetical protein